MLRALRARATKRRVVCTCTLNNSRQTSEIESWCLTTMAVGNNFRQIFDQFDKLNTTIEGVMKCSVNVGEDMQVKLTSWLQDRDGAWTGVGEG